LGNGFAVVLEEHRRLGAEVLAPALERALGMLRLDAVRAADPAGAFVAEDLDAGGAEALRGELVGAGVRARVVPPEKLVAADSPDCVRTLRIADDALHVTLGYTGPVVHVEWDRVALLSAGAVTDSEYVPPKNLVGDAMERGKLRAALLLGRSARRRRLEAEALGTLDRKRAEERGRRREFDVQLADVFARTDDRLLHVRLRSRDLYYQLILGPDFSRDISRDFPEVLARIGERASSAFVTPGYRAACLGPEAAGVADDNWCFGDERRFDEFNRWRLQMIVLGVDVGTDVGDDAGTEAAGRPTSFRPARAPPPSGAAETAVASTASTGAAGAAGAAGIGGPSALVGPEDVARPRGPLPLPLASRERELMEFGRRVESGFALFGKALRALVAATFVALLICSWARPLGYAPYILLGLALGDLAAMLFVVLNPAFVETLSGYHPDSLALEVLAFIFLAGYYWSGAAFVGEVEFGVDAYVVASAAGGGFFARLIAAFARETAGED
jgi:hypothetical protein